MSTLPIRFLALASWVALVASAARAGNVLVVDASNPPGTHASIQAALNVSTDGDTILVRAGTYARFIVPDRELSIVAEQGATVDIIGAPQLLSLSATRTVLLSGLTVTGAYNIGAVRADGLIVTNAMGHVRIEECSFDAPTAQSVDWCDPRRGAVVTTCQDVAFTRCFIRGQSGADFNFAKGGVGLHATGSKVALYDCVVLGGQGGGADACHGGVSNDLNCDYGYAGPGDGADGGAGCRFSVCEVMLSGCVVMGGDGGAVHPPAPTLFWFGGCGGNGIDTLGSASIWGLESAPTGGAGAPGTPSSAYTDGSPGVPVSPNPSVFRDLPGPARSSSAPRVHREGEKIPLHLEGMPGERVVLLLDFEPSRTPSLPFEGWFLVAHPPASRLVRLGHLDATGQLRTTLAAPDLPAGVLSRTLFVQSVHTDAFGACTLGPTQGIVVVDSSL